MLQEINISQLQCRDKLDPLLYIICNIGQSTNNTPVWLTWFASMASEGELYWTE